MQISDRSVVLAVLGVCCGVLLFNILQVLPEGISAYLAAMNEPKDYPELAALDMMLQEQAQHDQYEAYFQELAREKGAVYAFDVMKVAPIPHGLDTHLLGHAIGDILYEQEGVDGMAFCTHDFRNACSHTIVIGALLEYGTSANAEIQEACRQAPGGTGAYTMCFHGLGHGVLAFNGYNMEETAAMCRMMGTEAHNNREADQCFGGAVMEIISGGGHDREKWEERRAAYLQAEDPLALCNEPYLTEGERHYCYTYITPYLIEAAQGSVGQPSTEDWERVFAFCNEVPTDKPILRDSCFGGAGKEFIGIVAGRDFRNGIKIGPEAYRTMHEWCHLAEPDDGVAACQRSVTGSLFWGGENPLSVPLAFCAAGPDEQSEDTCYEALVHNISLFVPDQKYRETACDTLPTRLFESCQVKLLTEDVS